MRLIYFEISFEFHQKFFLIFIEFLSNFSHIFLVFIPNYLYKFATYFYEAFCHIFITSSKIFSFFQIPLPGLLLIKKKKSIFYLSLISNISNTCLFKFLSRNFQNFTKFFSNFLQNFSIFLPNQFLIFLFFHKLSRYFFHNFFELLAIFRSEIAPPPIIFRGYFGKYCFFEKNC